MYRFYEIHDVNASVSTMHAWDSAFWDHSKSEEWHHGMLLDLPEDIDFTGQWFKRSFWQLSPMVSIKQWNEELEGQRERYPQLGRRFDSRISGAFAQIVASAPIAFWARSEKAMVDLGLSRQGVSQDVERAWVDGNDFLSGGGPSWIHHPDLAIPLKSSLLVEMWVLAGYGYQADRNSESRRMWDSRRDLIQKRILAETQESDFTGLDDLSRRAYVSLRRMAQKSEGRGIEK